MKYDYIDDINFDGLRRVKISEGKWNLIDENDNLFLKQNYKFIYYLGIKNNMEGVK